jgi:serine protein kinase
MSILSKYKTRYIDHEAEEMSVMDYLNLCKGTRLAYASAAERMLHAIGEPQDVDTSKDERMSRIFSNRRLKIYPAFKDFHGMEDTIQDIVSFFRHAAQGLEESKQILYLLGPVGGGKSSLAERLKELMQRVPLYVLMGKNATTDKWEISPTYESPLGIFSQADDADEIEAEFGIPTRYLRYIMSPWAVKRLQESNGDIDAAFKV